MTDELKTLINLLPKRPGVYLMHDKDDVIIYVGKAKCLKNRVSQYFLRPQTGKVLAMVKRVKYFETIITHNEKEAFILEMNLIKEHSPRYNVLLKDGKHYPYIALKRKGDPFIKIARNTNDKHYYYFGPYPTSSYAYQVIKLLNKIFPTRKCRNIPNSPCLYYHLGQCLAPCINKIDDKTYDELFQKVKDFLDGKVDDVKKELKEKMQKASDELNFERANDLKETLKAIEAINTPQDVELNEKTPRDVFGYATREGYLALSVLTYRHGLLLGEETFVVERFNEINEQVQDLILQYYEGHNLPKEIVVNVKNINEMIESIYDVKVVSKSKGPLLNSIDIASINAEKELDAHFMSARLYDETLDLLDDLASRLHIKTPYRIELFDNSHLQGDASVGAMVVFINGEPAKKMYRKFNITGIEKRDDLASMKEVIRRRYKRLLDENAKMPDLILLDGGLNQILAAKEVLDDIKVNIPLFGLYKNDKHQTKGVVDLNGNTYDLSDNKALFFLLVRMQDEVHRFAIGFHHAKRTANFKKGILDNIEGLGSKRQRLILEHYPNLDLLKAASIDELSQIIPKDVAERLYLKLKQIASF